MKNHLITTICALILGSTPLLPAQDAADNKDVDLKMATVDMDRLFADYYKTRDVVTELQKYSKEVEKERDEKIEIIRGVAQEAEKLKKEAEDPAITGEKKRVVFNNSQLKQREVQQSAQMLQEWLQRKQAALIEKQNEDFAQVREELMKIAQEVATKEDYDYVFDSSGGSSSGLSVILFTKDAADITGLLLQTINKEAPAKTEDSKAK